MSQQRPRRDTRQIPDDEPTRTIKPHRGESHHSSPYPPHSHRSESRDPESRQSASRYAESERPAPRYPESRRSESRRPEPRRYPDDESGDEFSDEFDDEFDRPVREPRHPDSRQTRPRSDELRWAEPPDAPPYAPTPGPARQRQPAADGARRVWPPKNLQQTLFTYAQNLSPRGVRMVMLLTLLIMSLAGVIGAGIAYAQYAQARAAAESGITHLHHAQAILEPLMKHPALPSAATLAGLTTELTAAEHSFAVARTDMGSGTVESGVFAPIAASTVRSVAQMLTAADEACLAGLDLTSGLSPVLTVVQSGFFTPTTPASGVAPATPTLTAAMFATLRAKFQRAVAHLDVAIVNLQGADLSSLPTQFVSAQQIGQIRQLLASWPMIQTRLGQAQGWLQVAPALLGIGKPEQLLVELMDRAEMRATGGFIGAYGVMTLKQGKIQPFTLADIFALDVPYLKTNSPSLPPAQYAPWWPFNAYALRDSNLSPDFPTSAQMGASLLAKEGGPQVQGVVALNATTIERLLKIVGSIDVPGYNVTVTATNLESMIRLYTETSAQRDGNDLPVGYQLTSIHERFTALLGQQLMAKVRAIHGSGTASLIQVLLTSLSMKDVLAYFSDPQAEALTAQLGFNGAVATGPGDAVTVTDTNITGNKATAMTTVNYTDAVTLDAHGTATHHLTVSYLFNSASQPSLIHFLYKKDYYLTYLRIYVPASAHLVSFTGFNDGHVNTTKSDLPGHQMWAGLVDLPDGATYTLNFVWTVPSVATSDGAGHWRYALDYQRQSGSDQQLTLSVMAPGVKRPIVSFKGALDKDHTFTTTYQ
ncbi:MAG TPA: DUF4012 domain-containing protein [Ktedonobacterales bacterium]|nr:DUF4012 domain-containing protein [Ktedonobacterales bacterium]